MDNETQMSSAEALRDNMRRRRDQLRLSQRQVADRAGERLGALLHAASVSRYESGAQVPLLDNLDALAAALSCTPAELITPGWRLTPLPPGF